MVVKWLALMNTLNWDILMVMWLEKYLEIELVDGNIEGLLIEYP